MISASVHSLEVVCSFARDTRKLDRIAQETGCKSEGARKARIAGKPCYLVRVESRGLDSLRAFMLRIGAL